MEADRIARLTEAQREVLRRWQVRRSAKEIAIELGITHWAVNERLRAARRTLGAASSQEAAQMLARAEAGETYKPPSGNLEPSRADIEVTRRIVLAGRELDVTVHDHLLVAGTGWTSMRARGLL